MNRWSVCVWVVRGWVSAWVLLMSFGCVSYNGDPASQSSVTITGQPLSAIQEKTEEVFYRHGFNLKLIYPESMVFERKGGVTDNLLYGNWHVNNTITRVTVYFYPKDGGSYLLRARSIVIRDQFGSDEENDQLFDVQGAKYKSLLQKVRRELGGQS